MTTEDTGVLGATACMVLQQYKDGICGMDIRRSYIYRIYLAFHSSVDLIFICLP